MDGGGACARVTANEFLPLRIMAVGRTHWRASMIQASPPSAPSSSGFARVEGPLCPSLHSASMCVGSVTLRSRAYESPSPVRRPYRPYLAWNRAPLAIARQRWSSLSVHCTSIMTDGFALFSRSDFLSIYVGFEKFFLVHHVAVGCTLALMEYLIL